MKNTMQRYGLFPNLQVLGKEKVRKKHYLYSFYTFLLKKRSFAPKCVKNGLQNNPYST